MLALETATSVGNIRVRNAHPLVRSACSWRERPGSGSAIDDGSGTVISGSSPAASRGPRLPVEPGQQIGRYRLVERVGQGSQGEVWRALPLVGAGEEIALKVLPPILARDPNRLAQFRHEAERGARISGPGIVTTYEFGESDGVLFMVMPLVDGCSLSDVVSWRKKPGAFGPQLRLHRLALAGEAEYLEGVGQIMARVARGLAHVHRAGVVHRDIKPANILLDRRRDSEGFLCDFGLGRDLDVATPAQMRDGAGTPLYMAPERLLRYRADERLCDIYALGATLFEAVALSPPFQVPDDLPWQSWPAYLAKAHPVAPSAVRPGIPPELDAIILRAIERHPDLRYPSADALVADLEQFLGGDLARVRRPAGWATNPAVAIAANLV